MNGDVSVEFDAGLDIEARVRAALDEDGAFHDVTTIAIVPEDRQARARLRARQVGVVAGTACAIAAFRALDPHCTIDVVAADGSVVRAGETVLVVSGAARALLSAERVALNFMQRLSGIATLTARYVEAVRGTRARVLDTRKTTPGWRALEKYAVRMGGGANHRMDLRSAVLIKDNHLRAVNGDVHLALARVRAALASDGMTLAVEIEADRLEDVAAALETGVERILLDNMPLALVGQSVAFVAGRARLEASGGVTIDTIRAIALTGVDDISIGALTHSAPALDLGLDFD
jgi:nicotinate-nucleotide pyrophosphorylase (carboxylating)